MQTHRDADIQELINNQLHRQKLDPEKQRRLEEQAKKIFEARQSEITAGAPGEPIIGRWNHNGIEVVRRPDDPLGIVRISVGGGVNDVNDEPCDYVVFRGDPGKCVAMLRNALVALDWCTGASATANVR